VIGIFPGVGDALDAFMAVMVMRTAQQVEGGLPADIRSKMVFNIILDFVIGLTPIIGDIFDAMFRANTRNAVVLEKYLRNKGAKALKAQGQAGLVVDPSDPDEYDRMMREEHGPPPQYDSSELASTQPNVPQSRPSQAVPAQAGTKQRTGGWFSSFGRKGKQQDVEQGQMATGRQNDALSPLPEDQNRRDKSTLQKNRP